MVNTTGMATWMLGMALMAFHGLTWPIWYSWSRMPCTSSEMSGLVPPTPWRYAMSGA